VTCLIRVVTGLLVDVFSIQNSQRRMAPWLMNGVSAREQLWSKSMFLNRGAAARYWALASIILGPRLKEGKKKNYRAAVWQRLRTTGLNEVLSRYISWKTEERHKSRWIERLPNTIAEVYLKNNVLGISEMNLVSSGGHDMQRLLVCLSPVLEVISYPGQVSNWGPCFVKINFNILPVSA
jgi:hypothetical protein